MGQKMSKSRFPTTIAGFTALFGKLPLPQRRNWVVLLIAAVIGLVYLLYSLLFLGQVYPNVKIGTTSFAGLTAEEVARQLTAMTSELSGKTTEVRFGDQVNRLTQQEILWQVDVPATTERIYGYGRAENRWQSFVEHLTAPFLAHQINPVVSYDEQSLDSFVALVAQGADQPAVDATATIDGENITFVREKDGQVIDRALLKSQIVDAWQRFEPLSLTVERAVDKAAVVLGDEAALRSQVEELSGRSLELSYFATRKALTKKEIRQLIGFIGDPTSTATSRPLTASFTQDQAKRFLEELAAKVDQKAQEPKLVIRNGALAISGPSKEGRIIDIAPGAEQIVAALTATPPVGLVELPTKADQPIITEATLSTLGIKERIGYGETNFTGSPTNRRLNIVNGVIILQSALLKPGEEFSTVKTLGAVDASTGFLPELVIKENRTTPEYGGGLCQVSTTLFRSVMNAGLKVTERRNHSYRVSYYEPPVGLDATIYLPKPDFKFVNDTPAHILVQGRVEGNKVIFELWGTSDGRSSVISTPQILSTTPAGQPIYAETDTLFKGEVKQIEKAHDGAVTVATYTVTRNGAVINQQTFRSVYKAWPARFLVGTKEPPAPPPPPA